jgi:hypothetical protein
MLNRIYDRLSEYIKEIYGRLLALFSVKMVTSPLSVAKLKQNDQAAGKHESRS